jgi:D-ribose pyranose/furanose isomerase RbsD
VLSAEIGQIVFSLALATLGTSQSARRLLTTSMGIPTIISLVGNIQVALQVMKIALSHGLKHWHRPSLLATAYIIKEQILEAVEVRHANERAFQAALEEWQTATAMPEGYPYANALQDALRKANARRKETLSQMTVKD